LPRVRLPADDVANPARNRSNGDDQEVESKAVAKGDTVAQMKFVEKLFGTDA